MRGFLARVMQLGKGYQGPRELEVITSVEDLHELILKLGQLPDRSSMWDVFFIEGEPTGDEDVQLDEGYFAIDGIQVRISLVLMQGSLVFTTEGFTLYQNFSPGQSPDIPF